MNRYFTRPAARFPKPARAAWYDPTPMLPHLEVSDHEAADTGLVDQRGDPIMRAPNPMGFVWK